MPLKEIISGHQTADLTLSFTTILPRILISNGRIHELKATNMTPQYISQVNKYLPGLLESIGAKDKPIAISIQPEQDAAINSCFYNVARKVANDGGTVIYGWAIRPLKYVIEAEKHAIWKALDGTLVDVTPTLQPVSQILFVIDEDFVYTGQLVDNVRVNISENKVVDDWIFICEAIHNLYSYGRRTAEHEIQMPENLIPMLTRLEDFVKVFEPFLEANGSYNSVCFCGTQLLYKNCHGYDLRQPLTEALANVAAIMTQK